MELRGAAAIVTGAAGSIGRAVARRLSEEGCSLTLVARPGEALDDLVTEFDARPLVADLTDQADLRRVAEDCGDVDLLVVGSGVPAEGELTAFDLDRIDRVLDVNLKAPIVLSRLIGERMVARGSGHLVFISSLAAKTTAPATSLYNATMFGVRGFALGLRQDWEPHGVGVSCLNLGSVEDAVAPDGIALPAGFRPKAPQDVAAAVVRAVRRNKAEVDVADPVMRTGVVFGQVAPQFAARLQRFADGAAEQR